jgi:hypothetical protein
MVKKKESKISKNANINNIRYLGTSVKGTLMTNNDTVGIK